jgi:hypothetical protein
VGRRECGDRCGTMITVQGCRGLTLGVLFRPGAITREAVPYVVRAPFDRRNLPARSVLRHSCGSERCGHQAASVGDLRSLPTLKGFRTTSTHIWISLTFTGRFSRQLFVTAKAKRNVSRASSGPGVTVRPSRNAAKKASSSRR